MINLLDALDRKHVDSDAIRKLFQEIDTKLTDSPFDAELLKQLGHCSLILGNDQKAHECYQKSLHFKGTEDLELWYGIGLMYYKSNNYTYAEPSFLKVVMTDPLFPMINQIHFKLGLIFKRLCHYVHAITYFQKCLDSEESVPALCQLGYCYSQLSNQSEALKNFTEANDSGKSPYTALCLGWYLSTIDSTIALQHLNSGLELCQKDTVEELDLLYAIARVHCIKKDFNEASNCYYRLLNKNSGDHNPWNSFGIMCAEIGQASQAFRCFIKASEISPKSAEVWNNIGALYWKSGQLSESKLAYEKATKINSSREFVKEDTKEYIYSVWDVSEVPFIKRNAISKMKYEFQEPEQQRMPGIINPAAISQNLINSYAAMIGYMNYARHLTALRQVKEKSGNEDDKQAAEILSDLSQLPNKRNREI